MGDGVDRWVEDVALAIYETRVHAAIINGWRSEPDALKDRFRRAAVAALAAAGAVDDRDRLALIIRDWIHEQPWSLCSMGADTCPDWPLAYDLADRLSRSSGAVSQGEEDQPRDKVARALDAVRTGGLSLRKQAGSQLPEPEEDRQ